MLQDNLPDTLKNELGNHIVNLLNELGLWEVIIIGILVILLFMSLGALVLWLIKRDLFRVNLAQNRLELTEKLHHTRTKYDESRNKLVLSLQSLLRYTSATNINKTKQFHKQALQIFLFEFLPNFLKYRDVSYQLVGIVSTKKVVFVEDECLPFLNTVKAFLEAINSQEHLQLIDEKYLDLRNDKVLLAMKRWKKDVSFYRYNLRKDLDKAITNLYNQINIVS